jgi:intracellular multiplication protein IcmD
MKNFIQRTKWFLFLLLSSPIQCLWADANYESPGVSSGTSLGETAGNILTPIGVFTNVIYNVCYIVGVAFALGAVIRFKEYRENPSQTPISRPIAMLIFGFVIFAIPFVAKLSAGSAAA